MNAEPHPFPELGDLEASPLGGSRTVGLLDVWTSSLQGEAGGLD